MLSIWSLPAIAGLLLFGVQESHGSDVVGFKRHYPVHNITSTLTPTEYSSVTLETTTTITIPGYCPISSTTITVVNTTTETCTVTTPVTETATATATTVLPTTIVTPTTVVTPTTIVETTTIIVPTTITTTTTTTTPVYSTLTTTITAPYEECPTSCSVSAGTVNLFYWPTSNDYSYPSTYVHTALDYTFTSPSVYMVINTIFGTNSAARTGPAAASPVFGFDLGEVSTIDADGSTRQLTLNDLGTDCPQALPASVIATKLPDSRCDPILAAPAAIKTWARPCGACGPFGLFDPPYAVPTVTGGLFGSTTVVVPSEPTTALEATTTTPAETVVTSTTAPETTAVPETSETSASSSAPDSSSAPASSSGPASPSTPTTPSSPAPDSSSTSISADPTTTTSIPDFTTTGDPTTVPTASANRLVNGLAGLIVSLMVSIYLM
ncbi:hypothetical protein F4778DRAFT_610125 [Xylariomycetidae sp. FL2044]|nr:hypothetical protein F4778DRAFT_610125 [Xylariomycetidae sp. FL2044]